MAAGVDEAQRAREELAYAVQRAVHHRRRARRQQQQVALHASQVEFLV